MPYHIDEENSELAFEVREGNKLVIKIKSNIFSDSLELYLIKVGDNTEPTDKNVFSSLRVLKEIENLHDTILKEINSVTSGFWELKQDSQGNEYIATKYNVLTEGGLTTYGLGEQKLGTIYDGLPIDNDTIYWEEVEGSRVLKAKGSGGGSTGLDETKLWNVLGTPGDQQIDYSHLRSAFSQFSNEFVTIDTEQEITALKHFTAGLSIGSAKKKIYEKDGVLYIDSNVAITGALTMYATDGQSVSSIYDGLPIDNDTIYWETVEGSRVLKAKGSGGSSGNVSWGNISDKPTWIGDNKPTYNWSEIQGEKPFYTKEEVAAKFVTIDTEQEITALKHFTAGLSFGESKKKIYEENGVVYIDADVAVTGAMTFYATAGRTVSTIMDAVAVDGITITKEGNVLKAVSGSGSNFDKSAMWNALAGSTTEQINKTHLTTALTGYATESWVTSKNYLTSVSIATISDLNSGWDALLKAAPSAYVTRWPSFAEVTSKPTTLAGYGITDGFVKGSSNVYNTGKALSSIDKTNGSENSWNNASNASLKLQNSNNALSIIVDGAENNRNALIQVGHESTEYSANLGSLYLNKLGGNVYIGTTLAATIASNVASASQLQNTHTLWGQNFNGTQNVSGSLTGVTTINATGTIYTSGIVSVVGYKGNNIRIECDNSGGSLSARVDEINDYAANLCLQHDSSKGLQMCYGGGDVYIGNYTHSNTGKLNVAGWVQVQGGSECGFYFSEYEGGWYMKDTTYIRAVGDKTILTGGNILVGGGGTFYGSDIRYKSIIQPVPLLSLNKIAKAPSFVYHWNKEGMKCDRLNLGGSAQYTQSVLPWAVEDNDNFLSMDYATVAYTFAVHTARHLLTYEIRTDKKIKKLENRVKYLEKQLKKLGYEEVRTLDDQSV